MLTGKDLKELYACEVIESGDKSLTLVEPQKENKSALASVSLSISGEAIKINPAFFDRQKEAFRKHDKHKNYKKICDGAILYHRTDEKNYLIVVELKTGFNDVKKACEQISVSYVKLKMHLLNFPAYHAEDYEELGLIFSYPPVAEDYNDTTHNEMVFDAKRKMIKTTPLSPEEVYLNKCKLELEKQGKTTLDACQMHITSLPLKQDCLYDTLPIYHRAVGAANVSMSLDDDILAGV